MNIVNQDNLLTILNTYTVSTLPKSLLFIGEDGSGKHTMAKYLADKMEMSLVDFTDSISFESICDVSLNPIKTFYLINADKISIKEQNSVLKFVEEPAPSCHIIIVATKESVVLETIANRCIKYILNPYTADVLQTFLPEGADKSILTIATTPGQVIALQNVDLTKYEDFAVKFIENIGKAKLANVLTVTRVISKGLEKDKYDINILLKYFKKLLYNKAIHIPDAKYADALQLTLHFIKDLRSNYDYRYLIDDYLIMMKDVLK